MILARRFLAFPALALSFTVLFPATVRAATTVEVYPGPGLELVRSGIFRVEVANGSSWAPAFVYWFGRTSLCHWHFGTKPTVNFLTFGTDGPVNVRISGIPEPITSIDVSPHRKNFEVQLSGGQAVLTLNPNDKVWITANGADAYPLFIFADQLKAPVPPGATYFGPGVQDIAPAAGNHYKASTGEAIYIDGGAWVRGNIDVSGTRNVRIMGPGVLSGDLWKGEDLLSLPYDQQVQYAMVKGDFSGNGATVRDITVLDGPSNGIWGGATDVSGVKMLSPWFYGTDAFPGVGHIDHTLCFSGDEAFMPLYAGWQGDDFTITSSFVGTSNNACLAGGYWGYESHKGYTALADDIDIKTYDNDDWVSGGAPLMAAAVQIWMDNTSASAGYANQTYQNIHVDGNIGTPLLELQNRLYPWGTAGTASAPNPPLGNSYGVVVRNLTLEGVSKYRGILQGLDANNGFHNVVLDNVSIGGTPVTVANLGTYFDVNPFVAPMAVTASSDYLMGVVPVVGSAPGSGGSYFKTSVQLFNPNSTNFTLRFVFHSAGQPGSASDTSKVVTVLPGATIWIRDLLPIMGIASGLGSLDVFLPTGETRTISSTFRVFNDGGAAGTSGFNEEIVPFNKVFTSGATLLLICAPDPVKYRFNVGVRTLGDGASITATLRSSSGATIKTVTKSYAPDYFEQVTLDSFLGGAGSLTGSETLTVQVTAGQIVVYGATVDNRTNDSSASLAQRHWVH